MDDPNEENIESNWVMINSVDLAEEATVLDTGRFLDDDDPIAKNPDNVESDMESDGISIISESSHLHEGSNEDDNLSNNEDVNHDIDDVENNKNHIQIESAPQIKTNWTFVDSEPSPPKTAASNQFYLNCLQEPVQELSEHELGSVQSDIDSDGISIISDCESLNEFTEDDKKVEETLSENWEDYDTELVSKLSSGIKKYCNGVLIGTILLATSSIFLGHYFNSVEQTEEDLPIYKEELSNDLKETVPEKINDFKEKYEVPTALAYCQERHKSDDVFMEHNIKKCLNKIEKRIKRKRERFLKEEEMNKLSKYLKIKEQYLDEKEKFLIKREYELIKAELKLKNKRLRKNKKHKQGEQIDLDKHTQDLLNDLNNRNTKDPVINIIKNKRNYKEKVHKDVESNSKYEKQAKYRKERKHKFLREYHEKDNKFKGKKEGMVNYKLKKHEDERIINSKIIIDDTAKEIKESENSKNSRVSDDRQFDDTKVDRHARGKDKRYKGSTNYIVLGNNVNETISGYWVGRMYKGRNDMRNKRHSGDWYFDRASYRKTKRDKAKWYFDWMMDREILRYKRSFYM